MWTRVIDCDSVLSFADYKSLLEGESELIVDAPSTTVTAVGLLFLSSPAETKVSLVYTGKVRIVSIVEAKSNMVFVKEGETLKSLSYRKIQAICTI